MSSFDDEEPTRPDLPDSVRPVNPRNVAILKTIPRDGGRYSVNLSHQDGDEYPSTLPPKPIEADRIVRFESSIRTKGEYATRLDHLQKQCKS